MPYQILLKQDVGRHIESVIAEINKGVLALRLRGIYAEMPEEIKFSAMIIDRPQALPITTTVNRTGQVNQGGTNTVKETGTETTKSTGTTSQIPTRITTTEENGSQNTVGQTNDLSQQETAHGETVDTTDSELTTYTAGDSDTGDPDPLSGG